MSNSYAGKTAKIIGGKPSFDSAWPWMAGIIEKNKSDFDGQYCGGSLISSQWVLTAGHCVIGSDHINPKPANEIDIIINRSQLDTDMGERIAVSNIIIHPDYDDFTLENDLALIQLQNPSATQPIQLISTYSNLDLAGQNVTAMGWGKLSVTKNLFPSILHEVDLRITDLNSCANLPGVTSDMLCAGDLHQSKDTCTGDSGGPLIAFDVNSKSWKQVGITSWGNGCATRGFYGVYTRVKSYFNYISDVICSASDKPQPAELSLSIDGNSISAEWSPTPSNIGNILNYAPFPDAHPISNIDLKQHHSFSTTLQHGDAYYVGITRYHNNCHSDFSNIEQFVIH